MSDPWGRWGRSSWPDQIEVRYQIIRFRIENGQETSRYLGVRSTLEEAQRRAEHFLIPPSDTCRWDRVSDAVWALRDETGNPGFVVRRIKKPEEWEG